MIPSQAPLFKRVGSGRYPIAPILGAALPREVDWHREEVDADLTLIV
jgi:hypothetical protein